MYAKTTGPITRNTHSQFMCALIYKNKSLDVTGFEAAPRTIPGSDPALA